jgi:hypothetical protein
MGLYGADRGQVSLDYLLVVSVFLVLALVMFPALINLQKAAVFVLEVKRGQAFAESLSVKIEEMRLFGDGSCLEMRAQASQKWGISQGGNSVFLKISGSTHEKRFEIVPEGTVSVTPMDFTGVKKISVSKTGNTVSVSDGEC